MKVSELTGALLDYWVARAEGFEWAADIAPLAARGVPAYSTDWAQGGPLIDKYRMYLDGGNPHDQGWAAATGPANMAEHAHGDTPLQAICRAVVRATYGDEVPARATPAAAATPIPMAPPFRRK